MGTELRSSALESATKIGLQKQKPVQRARGDGGKRRSSSLTSKTAMPAACLLACARYRVPRERHQYHKSLHSIARRLALSALLTTGFANAAPQGGCSRRRARAKDVRQVTVRFSEPVVAFGSLTGRSLHGAVRR